MPDTFTEQANFLLSEQYRRVSQQICSEEGQELLHTLRAFNHESRTNVRQIVQYVLLRQLAFSQISSRLTRITPGDSLDTLYEHLLNSAQWAISLRRYIRETLDQLPDSYFYGLDPMPFPAGMDLAPWQEHFDAIRPTTVYEFAVFLCLYVPIHMYPANMQEYVQFIRSLLAEDQASPVPESEVIRDSSASLCIEDYPEEGPAPSRPVSTFERYMQTELRRHLCMDDIPIQAVRTIIDNAYLACSIPLEGTGRRGCVMCGIVFARDEAFCVLCKNSLMLPNMYRERIRHQVRLERAEQSLRDYHREMLQGTVLSYGARCPAKYAQPSYIGVELELEATAGSSTRTITKQVARRGMHGICKQDGSLENGVEFVTIPMPFAKAQSVLQEYCALAREYRLVAKHSCGMHIHLNRKGFSSRSHIIRFANLFSGKDENGRYYLSTRFLIAYVGKKRFDNNINEHGQYCKRGIPPIGLTDNNEIVTRDRYCMVSLAGSETVEVRWFAATTNESKVCSNIQFVVAAREYTRDNVYISWKGFARFVARNAEIYPDLLERLIRFRSVTQQELDEKESESQVTVETVL